MSLSSIRALLIDLSGTIHVENEVIPGAVEAVKRLRDAKVPLKFVTNTTKESQALLHGRLCNLGFGSTISSSDIFSSLTAARKYISERHLRPLLFLEDEAMEDFCNISTEDPNCVLLGLAPSHFHYERLNEAFRLIRDEGAALVAVHKAKYLKRKDGLAIGPGFFAAGLEYSTGCASVVVGKPEAKFFRSAVDEINLEHGTDIRIGEALMVGDDVMQDVLGAQMAGLRGGLVKTGKFSDGDETKETEDGKRPDFVFESFAQCVERVLSEFKS